MNPIDFIRNPHEQVHPWDVERIRDLAISRFRRDTSQMDIDDEDLADLVGGTSEEGAHTLLDELRAKHALKVVRMAADGDARIVALADAIAREERAEVAMYEAEAREAA